MCLCVWGGGGGRGVTCPRSLEEICREISLLLLKLLLNIWMPDSLGNHISYGFHTLTLTAESI